MVDSPLTNAFMNAFKYDMINGSPALRMGLGAGEHLAIDFYLDTQQKQFEGSDESKRGYE